MKYSFKITNGAGSAITVAVLPGTIPVLGNTVTQSGTTPFAVSAVTPHYHDKTAIAALFPSVEAVGDDGTIATDVTLAATDSRFPFRNFVQYIQKRKMYAKSLTIQASNADCYEESVTFRKDNPAEDNGQKTINLNDYFSVNQQQDGKITIPLTDNRNTLGLPLEATSMMFVTVPAGRNMTFHFNM